MNIFYISRDPKKAAEMMVDKHVVKMILETAQLLCTAHRLLDGTEYIETTEKGRKIKRWLLPDHREPILYKATHINHPSAVWVRQGNNNYNWLYAHFISLLDEYTFRYGKKHKCEFLREPLINPPNNIPIYYLTTPPQAMPEKYQSIDALASYREYYKYEKKHLHRWTKRSPPEWIEENFNEHSTL